MFLWDKLAAMAPDAHTHFLEDFVRPKPELPPARAATPAAQAGAGRAAGAPRRIAGDAAAAAAQLARVQATIAAAVSAIVGAEVPTSAPHNLPHTTPPSAITCAPYRHGWGLGFRAGPRHRAQQPQAGQTYQDGASAHSLCRSSTSSV